MPLTGYEGQKQQPTISNTSNKFKKYKGYTSTPSLRETQSTDATRRNHFSTIFHFGFIQILKKHSKICFFHICFPWKGLLTLTTGMGVGWGDRLGSQIPQIKTNRKKTLRTNIVHTSEDIFQKNSFFFEISSYIQKTTPNTINALAITIYNTKHTKNTEYISSDPTFLNKPNISENTHSNIK